MPDTLIIITSLALVSIAVAWLRFWPGAFADLLWMFPMRPAAVGAASLVVLLGLLGGLELILRVDHLSAARFLLVLALGPLVARPFADWAAYRLDKAHGGSRHYVFRWKLARLEASYRDALGGSGENT